MSVRIIAGHYRGRNLQTPDFKGENSPVRPTKARVREAGFNMIFSRMEFADKTAVDLFSGSGANGIEALSRGCEHVTFIDIDTKWTEENLKLCNIPTEQHSVRRANVLTHHSNEKADLIFADPPYGENLIEETLKRKELFGKAGSLWLIEIESKLDLKPENFGFETLKRKKYGKSTLYLLKQQ